MKMGEAFRRATEKAPAFAVKSSMSEDFRHHIRGDVFISMHDGKTGELQEYRELLNLVVLDDDGEAVLDFGEQPGDGHRIELGQMAEQAGIRGEARDGIGAEPQHIAEDRPQQAVCLV